MFREDNVDCRRFEATSNVGFDCALPAMRPLPGTACEDARVFWAKCDARVKWQGSWGGGAAGCSRRSGLGSVVPGAPAQRWQQLMLVRRELSERFRSQELSNSPSAVAIPTAVGSS